MDYPKRTNYSRTKVFYNEVVYLVNKIEVSDYHIDIVDAFRLCSLFVELRGDFMYCNKQPEDQLLCMFGDLKKFIKKQTKSG